MPARPANRTLACRKNLLRMHKPHTLMLDDDRNDDADVASFPTTFIAIPWTETYNPYQFQAWSHAATAAP